MLFGTPGAAEFISGVILYDETIKQKSLGGVAFPELLAKSGSIPGIKVDTGAKPLAGPTAKVETITEGLDGLRERFAEYYKLGARFGLLVVDEVHHFGSGARVEGGILVEKPNNGWISWGKPQRPPRVIIEAGARIGALAAGLAGAALAAGVPRRAPSSG